MHGEPGGGKTSIAKNLALQLNARAQDLAETIHPHPTLSEGIKEAALEIINKPIHILPKKEFTKN